MKTQANNYKKKAETKTPFFGQNTVFPKLTVNAPNDKYEQEADAMADRVMRMSSTETDELQTKPLTHSIQRMDEEDMQRKPIQRACSQCEEEAQRMPLMRQAAGGGFTAPAGLSSQLNSSKGGGQQLPEQTQNRMSRAFGTDFSQVRVHTSNKAQDMSQSIQAKAFTHGSDIYFNKGAYQPGSSSGDRLLAHELTHVVQQGGSKLKSHSLSREIISRQTIGQGKKTTPSESLLIWLNAFIPAHVPNGTETIKKGSLKGKTCIPAPWPFGCALTDNRSFSNKKNAKTRMRLFILVNLDDLSFQHGGYSDYTYHVDKESGGFKCIKKASANYYVRGKIMSKNKNALGLSFVADGNNPCVMGSPDIDFAGMIGIDKKARRLKVQAHLDEFPAFEMYVSSTKTFKTNTLFTSPPACNNSKNVTCLFGGPAVRVNSDINF